MQITASWGGEDVEVEVDEKCRSLAALKRALRSALPEEVDLEKVCLEVGGCAMEEEDVVALVEGSVIAVSPTLAARAVATLREEGCDLDAGAFCAAAQAGDVRLCGLYLDARVVCPPDDEAPLHVACREGKVAVCTLLLDRGCDVNVKGWGKDTPLHVAVRADSIELCTLLLDRGCDVDAKRSKKAEGKNNTPLHVALERENAALCTLLVRRGCDVNAKNSRENAPLHVAVKSGITELCTLLLDHG